MKSELFNELRNKEYRARKLSARISQEICSGCIASSLYVELYWPYLLLSTQNLAAKTADEIPRIVSIDPVFYSVVE